MYHLGLVLRLFGTEIATKSSDNSVQAHLEMWDGNEVIVHVHPSLNKEIKVNDYVLTRYTQPEPRIVKILKAKEGKELWKHFSDYYAEKKAAAQNPQILPRQQSSFEKMVG